MEEGKFVVYDNVLLGINKADEDALQQLLEQEPNTRILGSSFGVSLFRLGEHFFDSSKIAKKRLQTYEQLRELQQTKESQGEALSYKRKEEKLRNKLESFDIILEYGNAFMRTGNPAVLLDSMLVEKSAKNMKGYLINHGFFDAITQARTCRLLQCRGDKRRLWFTARRFVFAIGHFVCSLL